MFVELFCPGMKKKGNFLEDAKNELKTKKMRAETGYTLVPDFLDLVQYMMGKHPKLWIFYFPAFHEKLIILEGLGSRRGSRKMRLDLLRLLVIPDFF